MTKIVQIENFNFLSKVRMRYAEVLIELGLEWIESHPYHEPEDFLNFFLPPREEILQILKEEWMKKCFKKRLMLTFY